MRQWAILSGGRHRNHHKNQPCIRVFWLPDQKWQPQASSTTQWLVFPCWEWMRSHLQNNLRAYLSGQRHPTISKHLGAIVNTNHYPSKFYVNLKISEMRPAAGLLMAALSALIVDVFTWVAGHLAPGHWISLVSKAMAGQKRIYYANLGGWKRYCTSSTLISVYLQLLFLKMMRYNKWMVPIEIVQTRHEGLINVVKQPNC